MSVTKSGIDAVVALYADGDTVYPQTKEDPKYYNASAGATNGSDYYNTSPEERPDSYLTPVPSSAPGHKPPLPDPGADANFNRSNKLSQNSRPEPNEVQVLLPEESDSQVRLPLPSSAVKQRSGRKGGGGGDSEGVNPVQAALQQHHEDPNELQYSVVDVPPWYLCLVLGFQHYLIMFGATVANVNVMADHLCVGENAYKEKSELIGTIFVVSGIATLLQTFLGVRLPIIQGGTFTFVTPSVAILTSDRWKHCNASVAGAADPATVPYSNMTDSNITMVDPEAAWKPRILEIQGAIMVASLVQVVIGFSGIIGFLLRWIGPLAIAPTIALAGLALFDTASYYASQQWWITLATVFLIAMFSQYTKNIGIPCCKYERGQGFVRMSSFPLFRLFPVILAIVLTWIIIWILFLSGISPLDLGFSTADATKQLLNQSAWFRVPYPGQWGTPTVSLHSVGGMLAAVLANTVESVGDYYACARIANVPPPPMHAINRGIGIEGLACVLAGAFGSGSGTTSYSENIGAIGITKVASRRVIQLGAAMMIFFGIFSRFGAIFLTIPAPVTGGVFIVMFGMVTAVGISNLQFVDLNSSRNLFIIGFSFFFGLSLPKYVNAHPIQGNVFYEIANVLLQTSMFVGGMSGFILDNTIPGTEEERGLIRWRQTLIKRKKSRRSPDDPYWAQTGVYQIQGLNKYLKRYKWTKYVPFLPTFDEDLFKCKQRLPHKKKKKPNPGRAERAANGNTADTAL